MPSFLVRQEVDPTRVVEDHALHVAPLIRQSVARGEGFHSPDHDQAPHWVRSFAIFGPERHTFFMLYRAPDREALLAALGALPGIVSVDRVREIHHGNVLQELAAAGVT